MTEATPRISVRGLCKAFGPKQVLDHLDLDVAPGESLVIIGGSGSGKSVLLKCILGLIEPDRGSIRIDGVELSTLSRSEREKVRARIGMLFQAGALFDSLPVWENVCFGLLQLGRIRRTEARAKAAEVLAQVGLAASVADLWPAELSGGMQKRVALARAIAAQPDILFFDEPTTGLDPIMGAVIDGLIVDCVKRPGGKRCEGLLCAGFAPSRSLIPEDGDRRFRSMAIADPRDGDHPFRPMAIAGFAPWRSGFPRMPIA